MEKKLRKKLPGGRFQDVPASHSRRMRAIKGRGNKTTEARLRAFLVQSGIRGWKVHPQGFAGSPDFYFPDYQLIVFVDGCFWHGCPHCGHIPSVNRPFWKVKIERNQQRDRNNDSKLWEAGLRILRVGEHELQSDPSPCLERLKMMLQEGPRSFCLLFRFFRVRVPPGLSGPAPSGGVAAQQQEFPIVRDEHLMVAVPVVGDLLGLRDGKNVVFRFLAFDDAAARRLTRRQFVGAAGNLIRVNSPPLGRPASWFFRLMKQHTRGSERLAGGVE